MKFVTPIDLSKYSIQDIDDAAAVHYFGFAMSNGRWYIMREDTTENSFRYCFGGTETYAEGWATRAILEYKTLDQV